jgi:apolipoprotein N-acyltransferase
MNAAPDAKAPSINGRKSHFAGLPKHALRRERILVRVVFALLSAGLLICSLPASDIGWLAWFGLVPLLIACDGIAPKHAAAIGFVSGFVLAFGIYNWLFQLPAFGLRHAFVLAAYVAVYPALFCATLAVFNRWRAPLIFSAPTLWVAVEYLRANAGFLALPWGTLAQAQHKNLAILQFASIAGEPGVTFLVALGNAAIAEIILNVLSRSSAAPLWRREGQRGIFGTVDRQTIAAVWRRVFIVTAIIALAHGWGAYVLYGDRPETIIRVSAIQPNIQIAERESKQGTALSFKRLEQLTQSAAGSKPGLIVWPESAVAGNLLSNQGMVATLEDLTRAIGVPIIVGTAEAQKFSTGERRVTIRSQLFNAAYLLQPEAPLSQPYRKRVLLPFGEYLPYKEIIPWPEWLAPRVAEMTASENAHLFQLPNGVRVGALICWENLFAPLARESVASGAQVLVQLTNDIWFGKTAEPFQHNLASVLRAVENRVPVVIASNAGPSQIIDAYGRIVAAAPSVFAPEIVQADIAVAARETVFRRFGDGFLLLLMVAFVFRMRPHGFLGALRQFGKRRIALLLLALVGGVKR